MNIIKKTEEWTIGIEGALSFHAIEYYKGDSYNLHCPPHFLLTKSGQSVYLEPS